MATKKSSWVLVSFSIIAMGLLGSAPQAMAETLNLFGLYSPPLAAR